MDVRLTTSSTWNTYGLYCALHTTDANSTLYMTKANQLFIPGYGSLVDEDLKKIRARTLVIQLRTDLLFPPTEAKTVVETLKKDGAEVQTSNSTRHVDTSAGLPTSRSGRM